MIGSYGQISFHLWLQAINVFICPRLPLDHMSLGHVFFLLESRWNLYSFRPVQVPLFLIWKLSQPEICLKVGETCNLLRRFKYKFGHFIIYLTWHFFDSTNKYFLRTLPLPINVNFLWSECNLVQAFGLCVIAFCTYLLFWINCTRVFT